MRNSEDLYAMSVEELKGIGKDEIESWQNHPITRSLRLSLEGDNLGFTEAWSSGVFTADEAYATIQQNSKALGQVATILSILDWLKDPRGDTIE